MENNKEPLPMLNTFVPFQSLWDSINGKESFENNPWCWCISFERIGKPENFI